MVRMKHTARSCVSFMAPSFPCSTMYAHSPIGMLRFQLHHINHVHIHDEHTIFSSPVPFFSSVRLLMSYDRKVSAQFRGMPRVCGAQWAKKALDDRNDWKFKSDGILPFRYVRCTPISAHSLTTFDTIFASNKQRTHSDPNEIN